jgi:hypothetical protein
MCQSTARFLSLGPGGLYEMAPPGTFAYWLRQATRALRDAIFDGEGSGWRGIEYILDFSGNRVGIEDKPSKDMYDRDFWRTVDDEVGGPYVRLLQVRDDKQPADAIEAIITRPTRWRVDCDHIVQFSNLYALRMFLGADKFHQRVDSMIAAGARLRIRPRGSDGIKTIFHVGRDRPDQDWKLVLSFDQRRVVANNVQRNVQDKGPFDLGATHATRDQTADVLGRALTGSRVRWTNRMANLDRAFRHENAVKLEYDLFAAGGLDDPVTGNEFNQARLAAKLAAEEASTQSIQNDIFIDEIEVFDQG